MVRLLSRNVGRLKPNNSDLEEIKHFALNLNNYSLYILSLILMFPKKALLFYMNVRLRMYKYSFSNIGAIYAKYLLRVLRKQNSLFPVGPVMMSLLLYSNRAV